MSSFFDYPTGDARASDELVFLGDRGEEDWGRLLDYCEDVRFAAGDLLVRAGETDRTLYIVASGRFEVLLPGEGGGVRIGTIEPRSVAGEIAFIDGRPRSATLRALTDAEVFELRFEAFEILAVRHPELGRAILLDLARILAGRLRVTNDALAAARHR